MSDTATEADIRLYVDAHPDLAEHLRTKEGMQKLGRAVHILKRHGRWPPAIATPKTLAELKAEMFGHKEEE